MGIGNGAAAVGEQHACLFQGLNHALVGIAPAAMMIDNAPALKARRILGVEAIFIDGCWNTSEILTVQGSETGLVFDPDIVVIRAM